MAILNFTISELIKSDKANQYKISNIPNVSQIDNMLNLIFYCLQPIRDYYQVPIIITSGFRNAELNKLVGGKPNSQHLEGKAADFIVKGKSVSDTILKIKSLNLEYDQLINEYNKWIHISFNKGKNRNQILKY